MVLKRDLERGRLKLDKFVSRVRAHLVDEYRTFEATIARYAPKVVTPSAKMLAEHSKVLTPHARELLNIQAMKLKEYYDKLRAERRPNAPRATPLEPCKGYYRRCMALACVHMMEDIYEPATDTLRLVIDKHWRMPTIEELGHLRDEGRRIDKEREHIEDLNDSLENLPEAIVDPFRAREVPRYVRRAGDIESRVLSGFETADARELDAINDMDDGPVVQQRNRRVQHCSLCQSTQHKRPRCPQNPDALPPGRARARRRGPQIRREEAEIERDIVVISDDSDSDAL